jgi:hypothetical protein
MQLGPIVFIITWKALYMFRVLFTPIIRSVLNRTCSYWYNRAVRYKVIVKLMYCVIQVI